MTSYRNRLHLKSVIKMVMTSALVCASSVYGLTTINNDFKAATLSGSTIVAIDESGDLYSASSTDGNFTLRKDNTDNFFGIGAVGNTVIAVGNDGLILRSTNQGQSWSDIPRAEIGGSLNSVAGRTNGSDPNQWLAVGADPLDGVIFSSDNDGQSWTQANTIAEVHLSAVIWTGTRWLAAGRNTFDNTGVVYHSSNGTSWTASSLPQSPKPILSFAVNGNGSQIIATGENGEVLRSTDGGLNFSRIAENLFSGDLNTAVWDNVDSFILGGAELTAIRIRGTKVEFIANPTDGAPAIKKLLMVNGNPIAFGLFSGTQFRTSPLEITLNIEGENTLRIITSNSYLGKNYRLETSNDLSSWQIVQGTTRAGTGGRLTFDIPLPVENKLWRVVEF